MGLIYADLELVSADDIALERKGYIKKEDIKKENVKALVGSGAYMMCINEHIKSQLDLSVVDTMEAELTDGPSHNMDVVLVPKLNTIDVNPRSKYMAKKKIK